MGVACNIGPKGVHDEIDRGEIRKKNLPAERNLVGA